MYSDIRTFFHRQILNPSTDLLREAFDQLEAGPLLRRQLEADAVILDRYTSLAMVARNFEVDAKLFRWHSQMRT